MVVQHNLTAMNSNRMLGLTTASQAKSTEKLSSGYKINRAADDAAGLSTKYVKIYIFLLTDEQVCFIIETIQGNQGAKNLLTQHHSIGNNKIPIIL